jgi:CheY-like chemotaxis protein
MTRDILLVEDDMDVREAIAEGLEDVGYHVVAVADGRAALEYLRAARDRLPGLILLDLMMPTMDGWEFHEQMSREPGCAEIPVVVLSAAGISEDKVALLHVAGYLRKPLNLLQLRETAQLHCGPPERR